MHPFCCFPFKYFGALNSKWISLLLRAIGSKDFDDSSAKDEFFYGGDTSESSECSSLSGSEEQSEAEQQIEHPNGLFGTEKYFSALSFSRSTPNSNPPQKYLQSEKSGHKERDSHEICESTDALALFMLTQHKRKILSSSGPEASKESHLSSRDSHYTHSLVSNCWPLGGLLENPFCIDRGCGNDPEMHLSASGLKGCKGNIQVSKEGVSNSKTLGNDNAFTEEILGEGQLHNGYGTSNLFSMQGLKLNYSGNIFSINPMLTRNTLFHQTGKSGERCTTDLGQSFPYFDFSSVEDACKVCVEKLTVGSRQAVFKDSSQSAISTKGDLFNEQRYPVHEILLDNTKGSCVYPHLDLKDHEKNLVATNISSTSSWESLLYTSNNIENTTVKDHRQEFSAIFEIPLDFIIDKCLLQEILLQYPFFSYHGITLMFPFAFIVHV